MSVTEPIACEASQTCLAELAPAAANFSKHAIPKKCYADMRVHTLHTEGPVLLHCSSFCTCGGHNTRTVWSSEHYDSGSQDVGPLLAAQQSAAFKICCCVLILLLQH